ncbi:hypothetical protein [Proteus mirabilis]|nr:hypothetical protein [Proteus mirabilis]
MSLSKSQTLKFVTQSLSLKETLSGCEVKADSAQQAQHTQSM